MATWKQFSDYIHVRYKVSDVSDDGTVVKLLFNLGGGRSQVVLLCLSGNDTVGEWAEILSPIGQLTDSQAHQALVMMNEKVCGGLVGWNDGTVLVKHTLPLKTFVAQDFEWMMEVVTAAADEYESSILGTDDM